MKYTPRTWKYGDYIKPQDMNSIENAIKETDSCIYAVGTY